MGMRRITLAWLPGAVGAVLLWGTALNAQEAETAAPAPDQARERELTRLWDELPAEVRHVLTKLDEANAKVEDVSARVTYERAIPILDEKQKSRGTLTFKKPNRIVLKLGKPRNEEVITDGRLWWVVSHNDKQVEVYEAAEAGEGGTEAAFLDFGYGRSARELLADYSVKLTDQEKLETDEGVQKRYRLEFVPRENPARPAVYEAVEIELSDSLWLPEELVLHEAGGEIIHTYALRKIRTNTGVKDKAFDYKPPGSYQKIEPQKF